MLDNLLQAALQKVHLQIRHEVLLNVVKCTLGFLHVARFSNVWTVSHQKYAQQCFIIVLNSIESYTPKLLIIFNTWFYSCMWINVSESVLQCHKCHLLVCAGGKMQLMLEVLVVMLQIDVFLIQLASGRELEWDHALDHFSFLRLLLLHEDFELIRRLRTGHMSFF